MRWHLTSVGWRESPVWPPPGAREQRLYLTEAGGLGEAEPGKAAVEWLHDPENDALWQLACELDFPISIHGEYRHLRFQPFEYNKDSQFEASAQLGKQRLSLRGLDHALGFPFDNMTTLGYFIFTGILDRFPRLRLGLLESNAGWLPFWLGRMDDHTHGRNSVMGNAVDRLPLRPTEYFMRQCSLACDSDERALKSVVEYLNGDNLVWNSDYPHPDAPEPAEALPDLDAQPISQEAKRKILWDNSVRLYGPRILS